MLSRSWNLKLRNLEPRTSKFLIHAFPQLFYFEEASNFKLRTSNFEHPLPYLLIMHTSHQEIRGSGFIED